MSTAITSELREAAIIEVTAKDPAIPNRKLTGTVRTTEKKILTVITDEAITGSAAIRVQTKDLLSFGEVLDCVPRTGREVDRIYRGETQDTHRVGSRAGRIAPGRVDSRRPAYVWPMLYA